MNDIIKFGKKIVDAGLVTSFFGNISISDGKQINITRTGSMLDELTVDDIVTVDLMHPSDADKFASTELIVHRKIYQNAIASAIIHTHSLYSTLMGNIDRHFVSLEAGEILPFLKKIPVVDGKSGSIELAKNVSEALINYSIVIVRDHGVFAVGKDLRECFVRLTSLEHYSKYNIIKKYLL
ncbi:MAG: class II aldolase/adducin family protein [Calditerrivibrio sp.]|nr:class II aldolase/adducin family protein [Calditerrivibrio sp.]MCA1932341.1 class II aldolase/adducin family protein [Calditerrivibrio sp.]